MKTHLRIGDRDIRRLGFGAMRLSGPGVWGHPADYEGAKAVARLAVEEGITFIDTADSYGPGTNEELLADALHPYPADVMMATKVGQSRPSATEWVPLGRPEYIRQQAELSLRRLRLDTIELFQLHRIDPLVDEADQFGALKRLQDEGKILHIGLSEVGIEQLERAREVIDIVSVQNLYNIEDRRHEAVLDHCEREGIAFIPWVPIARGEHAGPNSPVADIARELDATPAQVCLSWLLHRSDVVVPIPGTSSAAHLKENRAAEQLELDEEQLRRLSAIGEI